MYQNIEHFETLNCIKEDENLDTLDKDELVRRLDKSFDIKLEKVRNSKEGSWSDGFGETHTLCYRSS